MSIEISAAVCSFNRAEMLRECLRSLLAQEIGDSYQVIVVDNGCTDNTPAVVEEVLKTADSRVKVNYIRHEQNIGLAAARNTALQEATGEIIAFTDDDTIVDKDWLANIVRCFRDHPEIIGAGGSVRNGHVNSVIAEIGQQIVTAGLHGHIDEVYTRFLVGNNQSYRRAAVEQVGGFDERMILGGEEAELQLRLLESGGRMLFDPDIRVTHYQRTTLSSFVKQYYRYGVSTHILMMKYAARPNSQIALKAPVLQQLKRILLRPWAVMQHLETGRAKLLAVPLVYLSSISRAFGYTAAILAARFRFAQGLTPRA